ncbi:MAG: NAD(P)H-dependent oxidoreductase [Dysgonamonadaceae bacterium]|jgi:chromate reductase|nr:NAD(P)H-dependent oxidoreductase [Dysgonamonadaceae bacterium]
MNRLKVLALIGGISKDSLNKRLYHELVKHNTANIVLQTCELSTLPFYSQDIENNPPESVVHFQGLVKEADAVLFITPEYNRSFPGVLKNAIDWGSRPLQNNLWRRKPAAIIGASLGKIGTFGAQQHLKNVCCFLDMNLMHQPEFYFDASASMDATGVVAGSIEFIQMYLSKFAEFCEGL